MFLKEVSSAHQDSIYLIKINKNYCENCEITVFIFEYISKCNLFLWCKAEFSAATSPSIECVYQFNKFHDKNISIENSNFIVIIFHNI